MHSKIKDTVVVGVRMPNALRKRLQVLAENDGRTLNSFIRFYLNVLIDSLEEEEVPDDL